MFGVLEKTTEAGSRELLIAAQDELVKPSRMFEAEMWEANHA